MEARHLHKVEHPKTNITLDMLERISARLDVDSIAIMAMASSYKRRDSLATFNVHLLAEMKKLKH